MTTATTTAPQPGTLTVSFENISMAKDLKKAIGMLRGVTKVSIPRRRRLTAHEEALRDIAEGRVCTYDSLDDFIKEIENE